VQIPEAFRSAAGALLVIRFEAPDLGTFEASRPLADLGEQPPSLSSLLNLARKAEEDKKGAEAVAWFEEGLKHYPDDAGLLNSFAWFLVDTSEEPRRDPKRAADLARKAVRLTKEENGNNLDTLAVALHQCGNLEEAARLAGKAAKLSPGQEEIVERARQYQDDAKAGKEKQP
jgi:Flp pilus assembly protein TadD